jgi:3-hydroxybutyryl-CoA dehydrogenase
MTYRCDACGRQWDFPVQLCIFCNEPVSKVDIAKFTVEGTTQVFVPSDGHPVTPYYILLLKDSDGSFAFQKTFAHYDIGDAIYVKGSKDKASTIGVVGTGVTGKGIVEVALKTGSMVILKSRSEESLEGAIEIISKNLSKAMEPEDLESALGRITATTRYECLAAADLVVESVTEDLRIKREIFRELDCVCSPHVVLASNTSSFLISEIAKDLKCPERVVGMHFFNPIPKMKLVEIAKAEKTSDEVLKKADEFAAKFNKVSVCVKDTAGFIVNRMLFIMINEAFRMLEEGVASVEEIDKAMKMGANHPMGPFELADLIGRDLCLEIIENLNASFGGNRFEPSSILRRFKD